jgi:iron uptake system EfeUOB component EfeO/EfeM
VNVYVVHGGGKEDVVYAEIQDLAPHATLPLNTVLGAGSYAVRCVFSDGELGTSPAIRVSGHADGAVPGYQALPDLALQEPVREYTSWVRAQLPGLASACRTLDADVARGDVVTARRDWLTAHLDYERLGAAYNAFGDFDGEIDGMANGLPGGAADPGWTGFFALEYALWHDAPAARAKALSGRLVADVDGLIQDFPSDEIDPGDLALRAHEILENSLQFQATGIADYGSGTTSATVYANTQGMQELLAILGPLMEPRDPRLLAQSESEVASLQRLLVTLRAPDGSWTPVTRLSDSDRQRLDAQLGQLLETLSGIPELLFPRTDA